MPRPPRQGMTQKPGLAIVQEHKDPNVAPRGCAFTPETARQIMTAIEGGIHEIMKQFNIKAYSMSMVMPLVEWRKDIPIPGGGTKDDFVILKGWPHYLGGPFQPTEKTIEIIRTLAPAVWNDCYAPKATDDSLTAVASEGTPGETPIVPEAPIETAEPSTDGPGSIIPMAGVPETQPPQEAPPA